MAKGAWGRVEVRLDDAVIAVLRKPYLGGGRYRCIEVRPGRPGTKCHTLLSATRTRAGDEVALLASKIREEEMAKRDPEGRGPKAITVAEAFSVYLRAKNEDWEETTRVVARGRAKCFTALLGASTIVSAIDRETIRDVLEALRARKVNRRDGPQPLAAATLISMKAWLNIAFSFFEEEGYITRGANPVPQHTPKKQRQEARASRRRSRWACEPEEAVRIIEECGRPAVWRISTAFGGPVTLTNDHEDCRLFALIAFATGLRAGNVAGLSKGMRWGDLRDGWLCIDGSRMKNHCDLKVPLSAEVLAALEVRLRSLGRRPDPDEPILQRRPNQKIWIAAVKRAGVARPDMGPFVMHGARHSFTTWLQVRGVAEPVIQVLRGDVHDASAVRMYSHLGQLVEGRAALVEAVGRLPALLGKNLKKDLNQNEKSIG